MTESIDITALTDEVVRRIVAMTENGKRTPEAHVSHQRVVSLEQLNGVSENVEILDIRKRAILTPAAKDWLSEKNIVVRRGKIGDEQSECKKPSTNWKVMTVGTRGAELPNTTELMQEGLDFKCIVKASNKCRKWVAEGTPVMLFAGESDMALIVLNRHSDIRAIKGRKYEELESVLPKTGANVIVFDMRQDDAGALANRVWKLKYQPKAAPKWL